MTNKTKKLSKKLLSITLCIVMLATTFFIFDPLAIKVSAATGTTTVNGVSCTWNDAAWSGTRQTSQPADFKVSGNNYYIGSAAALSYFEYTITNNGTTYSGKTVYLVHDINLNNKAWTSIGDTGSRTFQGTFDGRGYSIIGLNVTSTDNDRGFFRKFTGNTTIKNVKFKNAKICSSSNYGGCSHGVVVGWVQGSNITFDGIEVYDSAVYGSCFVGGLAGAVEAVMTVKNCKFEWTGTGNLQNSAAIVATNGRDGDNSYTGGIIGKLQAGGSASAPLLFQNCSTIAKLTASSGRGIGGIVGMHIQDNYVKFDRCTSRCNLETNKVYTAGIIGYDQGFVTMVDCTAYGDGAGYTNAKIVADGYSGGLVGEIQDDICAFTRCYNYMNITGTNQSLGGMIGKISGGNNLPFVNCENYGTIQTSNQFAGGFVGYFNNNATISFTNCKNTADMKASKHAGGFVGASEGYVNASNCVNDGNATTTVNEHAAGFAAYIADDGCSFTDCINNGNITVPSGKNCAGGIVSGTGTTVGGANWNFTRCTNNGKITGSAAVAGLFGYTGNDSKDPNVYFTDCVNNGEVLGYGAEIGGMMGNFDSDGKIKFEKCKNTGYVHFSGTSSSQLVGGLLGKSIGNNDEFIDCINTGNVSSNSTSNSQGNSTAGGMIGYKGENNELKFTHCYNTGNITAYYGAGGLVGDTSGNVNATDSYNLGTISVRASSIGHAGGIGGVIRAGFTATRCFNGNGTTGAIASSSTPAHDAGGLAGYVNGGSTFTNCYNNAKVYAGTSDSNYAGGLIGEANGSVSASYCYNAGAISGSYKHTISSKNAPSSLSTCYYLSGTGATNGTAKTDTQLKAAAMISSLSSAYSQDLAGRNTYYPILNCYKEDFHFIDVAGYLESQESDNIAGYGTADVYINGTRVAQNCTDYNVLHPVGTTYEINNITPAQGYVYSGLWQDANGWHNGLTGTVAKLSPDVMGARLSFNEEIAPGGRVNIIFDGQSATTLPTATLVALLYNPMPSITPPTRSGYTFNGFYTALNGSGTKYYNADGTSAKDLDIVQNNVTLYAYWTPTSYTVTFNTDGGNAVANKTYNIQNNTTLPSATRIGSKFVGWKVVTASGNWTAGSTFAAGANLNGKYGNVTLKAQWSAVSYTSKSAATEYYYPVGTEFVEYIGLVNKGKFSTYSLSDKLKGYGYNYVIGKDLNDGAGGDYVRMGYSKTTDISKAIRAVGFYCGGDKGESLVYNGSTYYLVGSSSVVSNNMAYGAVDLNESAGGAYIFTFASKDIKAGPPVTSIDAGSGSSATFPNCIGVWVGKSSDNDAILGGVADLNKGAGGDDIFTCQYADGCTTVNSTALRQSMTQAATLLQNYSVYTESSVANLRSALSAAMPCYEALQSYAASTYNQTSIDTLNSNLVAAINALQSKVYLNPNGGMLNGSANEISVDVTFGAAQTVSFDVSGYVPTKEGYIFLGWATAPTAASGSTTTVNVGFNAHLYAIFTKRYDIEYNLNGGTADGNPEFFTSVTETFTLNNPTKTGYTFTGWTGSNGSTPETTVTIAKGSTGNREYIANWTLTQYTITYNLNGGTATNPNGYNYETATFTLNNPVKTGYTFLGWGSASIDGTAMTVTIPQGSTGNRSYTAIWAGNPYTVKFDANGGTGTMASQTFNYDVSQRLSANSFQKEGCFFAGWSTTADDDNVLYYNKQFVNNLVSESNGEVTLYAVWYTIPEFEVEIPSYCGEVRWSKHTDLEKYYVATVTAPMIKGGAYFVYWKATYNDGTVEIASTYRSYSFFVTRDVILEPFYAATQSEYTTERAKALIVSRITGFEENRNGTSTLLVEHSVSPNAIGNQTSIIGHGVVYTTNELYKDNLTVDNENDDVVNKIARTSADNLSGLLEVNVGNTSKVWAVPYIIDKNANVYYGEMKEVDATQTLAIDEVVMTNSVMSFDLTEMNTDADELVIEETKPVEETQPEQPKSFIEKLVEFVTFLFENFVAIIKKLGVIK